jgi:hypothetical protein
MWALYNIYQTIEIVRRDRVRRPRNPPLGKGAAVPANATGVAPENCIGFAQGWKLKGREGFMFSRSKVKGFQEAVEGERAVAGRVRVDGSGLGYRSGHDDIEKGAMGRGDF